MVRGPGWHYLSPQCRLRAGQQLLALAQLFLDWAGPQGCKRPSPEGWRELRHLRERGQGRWRAGATAGKSALGFPGGLIGGKNDGSRGRANGSRWGAKQSWTQDWSWEEGGGRCGGRPEGQGPWQGTDGCRRSGERAGQEAGCQGLGELLLQGQFRLEETHSQCCMLLQLAVLAGGLGGLPSQAVFVPPAAQVLLELGL